MSNVRFWVDVGLWVEELQVLFGSELSVTVSGIALISLCSGRCRSADVGHCFSERDSRLQGGEPSGPGPGWGFLTGALVLEPGSRTALVFKP